MNAVQIHMRKERKLESGTAYPQGDHYLWVVMTTAWAWPLISDLKYAWCVYIYITDRWGSSFCFRFCNCVCKIKNRIHVYPLATCLMSYQNHHENENSHLKIKKFRPRKRACFFFYLKKLMSMQCKLSGALNLMIYYTDH